MKTKLFLFLILLSVWSCKPNSLDTNGLKGKVKSVTTNTYEVDEYDEYETGDLLYSVVLEFDEDGYLKKETNYDQNEDMTGYREYTYTDGICTAWYHYSKDSELESSRVIIFENGEPVRVENDEKSSHPKDKFEFDGNKIVYEVLYNEDEDKKFSRRYTYNDDDLLVKYVEKEGDHSYKNEYEWSDDGLLLSYKFKGTHSQLKYTYEYDEDNHCVKITRKSDGEKEITRYKYLEYDEEGNWTKRLISVDGEPSSIEAREIEYY